MSDVRVRYQTVTTAPSSKGTITLASAAADATCRQCGGEVLEDEPVALVGAYVAEDEDGNREVDLTGAHWVDLRCAASGR